MVVSVTPYFLEADSTPFSPAYSRISFLKEGEYRFPLVGCLFFPPATFTSSPFASVIFSLLSPDYG
jgi:hypothetical protein